MLDFDYYRRTKIEFVNVNKAGYDCRNVMERDVVYTYLGLESSFSN